MSMKKFFQSVGVIAVILAGLGYAAYRLSTKVWVERSSLKNLRPTWEGLTGTVVMRIKNSSQTPLPIQGFQGIILYNGINMADLRIGPSVIQPSTTTDVEVNFQALWTQLPNSIEQIFKQQAWYPSFSVKGTLYAAQLQVPINQQLYLI